MQAKTQLFAGLTIRTIFFWWIPTEYVSLTGCCWSGLQCWLKIVMSCAQSFSSFFFLTSRGLKLHGFFYQKRLVTRWKSFTELKTHGLWQTWHFYQNFNASLTKSLQSPLLSDQAAGHRAGDGDPLVVLLVTRLRLLASDWVDNLLYVSDFAGDEFERLV